jgi:hypothetical protein
MTESNFDKLNISFDNGLNDQGSKFPRCYTLTHSDITGNLFLTVGPTYDHEKLSGLYGKLMRDEILGEWKNDDQPSLHIHCHCSGGIVIGSAKWRDSIFRYHMPAVLEAIFHGDQLFIAEENPELLKAPVYVHFHAKQKPLDRIEKWGIIEDFYTKK